MPARGRGGRRSHAARAARALWFPARTRQGRPGPPAGLHPRRDLVVHDRRRNGQAHAGHRHAGDDRELRSALMDIGQARAILDLAHSAFVSMDEDGRIVYWNIRAEEIFGLSREEAVGRVLADTVIPERLREAHWEGLRRFRETGEGEVLNKRLEMTALRSDGSEFPVELTISALSEPEGWSFHAFVADVSERVRLDMERQLLLDDLQHALRGTEERLAVIVDALGEAVTIRGPDDHLIHANRAALDRLGLSSVEELREAD